eukprot:7053954-Prymnesium_polylepis.1
MVALVSIAIICIVDALLPQHEELAALFSLSQALLLTMGMVVQVALSVAVLNACVAYPQIVGTMAGLALAISKLGLTVSHVFTNEDILWSARSLLPMEPTYVKLYCVFLSTALLLATAVGMRGRYDGKPTAEPNYS